MDLEEIYIFDALDGDERMLKIIPEIVLSILIYLHILFRWLTGPARILYTFR